MKLLDEPGRKPTLPQSRSGISERPAQGPVLGWCWPPDCKPALHRKHGFGAAACSTEQGGAHPEPQSLSGSTWLRTVGSLPFLDQSTKSSSGRPSAELVLGWGWMPRISSFAASSSGVKSLQAGARR